MCASCCGSAPSACARRERDADAGRDAAQQRRTQIEALRKMLLAFAQDIRVVLVRLASRLQTLRWLAQDRSAAPGVAQDATSCPLANRLGIWQLKWELEDLAFRFEEPVTYKRIAKLLDESASSAKAISRRRSRGCSRAGAAHIPPR
jgi:GTP pyrophosphokinase